MLNLRKITCFTLFHQNLNKTLIFGHDCYKNNKIIKFEKHLKKAKNSIQ